MANERTNSGVPSTCQRCPECESTDINTSYEIETVPYGSGDETVNLTCRVPVVKCGNCGTAFTDDQAADIRHEAVCRYLKVLTPAEILEIRKHYGLSRNEFSKLTHVGEASLARWENGHLIQNSANDQLLFLMQYPENVERLRNREQAGPQASIKQNVGVKIPNCGESTLVSRKTFRALTHSDEEKYSVVAKTFTLRRVAA